MTNDDCDDDEKEGQVKMANEDDYDTSCRILKSGLDHCQGELPHRVRSSGEIEMYLQTANLLRREVNYSGFHLVLFFSMNHL